MFKKPYRNSHVNPQEYASEPKPISSSEELSNSYFCMPDKHLQKTYRSFYEPVWITPRSMKKLSTSDVQKIWEDIKISRTVSLKEVFDILGKIDNF